MIVKKRNLTLKVLLKTLINNTRRKRSTITDKNILIVEQIKKTKRKRMHRKKMMMKSLRF